jgi:hypothetical protein
MQTNQFRCEGEFYRFIVLALLLSPFMPATAQQKQAIAGDYAGTDKRGNVVGNLSLRRGAGN